ncbi:MAG TPA: hypothetical protein VFX14_24175 [Methylomirabilota bacterium]|nr:hypothetical protein [Methylomirabilota bacterium]
MTMRVGLVMLVVGLSSAALTSCVVYEPVAVAPSPSTYDRAYSAALGGLQDAGVQVTSADPATGLIRGVRDGINASVAVTRQVDGSVRVQMDTSGQTERDPDLHARFTQAYNRRMGR